MSDLGDMLRTATDRELEKIQNEVATEGAIRTIMKDTGEPRDIVTEMIEAGQAMGEEMVLDLTEGEPTTLRAALEAFVEQIRPSLPEDATLPADEVCTALSALLEHRWPEDDYEPPVGLPDAWQVSSRE